MATTVKIGRFQFQNRTKKEWEESNLILLKGELAIESDTSKIKIGDGRSYYPDLPYILVGEIRFKDLTEEEIESLRGATGKTGEPAKLLDVTYDKDNNTILTFADKDKPEGVEVLIHAGKDGYTPKKGVDYFDGKDGVVTIDNLSDEELKRFKDLALPTLEDDLKRATEFDALQGTDDKRIMTPLTTKKAIESMEYDEKISQKTSLEDIETAYSDGMIALAHLADTGKDLVDNGGKLFRSDIEVGVRVKNAGTTYTIPDTVQKARIYFKAQCEEPTFDNYIFFWVGDGTDENQRFVSKLENRTRHYSAEVNLENSHEIVISTVQAWDKTVKMWDFDWKEVL